MSLPETYKSPVEYFTAALKFLDDHSWIYSEANTRIISAQILDRIPNAFKEYFSQISNEELNYFPFVHEEDIFTSSEPHRTIIEFRKKLAELIPQAAFQNAKQAEVAINGHKTTLHKVSAKKKHEIIELAAFIHKHCADAPLYVDLGAGLGYLSEILYTHNKNKSLILGLEADEQRVEAARKRLLQATTHGAAKSISYQQQYINEDSHEFITKAAQELLLKQCDMLGTPPPPPPTPPLKTPKISLIGLHACADLSISAMKLFLQMPQVQHLAIMPCCYHKLKVCDGANAGFVNFPLSEALRLVIKQRHGCVGGGVGASYLNRPFLRLACQQTSARWRTMSEYEHYQHSRQLLLRALAEAVVDVNNNEFVCKLKAINPTTTTTTRTSTTTQPLTFAHLRDAYVLRSTAVTGTDTTLPWREVHEERFNVINDKFKANGIGYKLAEALTCLQTSMQKLCENVLLYDRLCFMTEQAANLKEKLHVSYEKLLDEKLSPRCYVLLAKKFS